MIPRIPRIKDRLASSLRLCDDPLAFSQPQAFTECIGDLRMYVRMCVLKKCLLGKVSLVIVMQSCSR